MTDGDTNSEWNTWFDHWQNTIASDGRMFPIVAARGNHEDSNNSIYNLFDVPSSSVYYAITFGGSLVTTYTLNTEISIAGSQTTWLASDLQSNTATWKMAQYHKPMRPHVSSKSEGNSEYNNWSSLFYDNGVKLVVECDSHTVKTTWPVRPSTDSGSDEGFIRDDDNGTVYVGEGCWGAPLRTNNDNKAWTRNSGQFNQFKWIFVDQGKIEIRTIQVDNADQVGEVSNNNRFIPPANLDIWNPSNGAVVTITGNLSSPTCSITSPTNGQYYATPQNITINANASDTDGNVTSVEFFVNEISIGTDTTSPYAMNYVIPADGAYALTAVATDNDGLTTTTDAVNITVGVVNETIEKRIASSMDDVEQNGTNGSMYTDSSDIELVNDGSRGDQTIGLRFTGINIPQGATINNAYIQFTTDETSSGTTNLTIRGQDVNDAPAFTTSTNNVSGRTTTSASVNWNPPAWNSVGAAGLGQRTPGIESIIQEIVDRPGWNSGNDMVMIITGTGERTAESYDGVPNSAALIHIEYTAGGGTPNNIAPTCAVTAPSDGTNYTSLQTISISANATDNDGSISQVEFFVNEGSVGTDVTSPYTVNWSLPADGAYTLTAVATDNDGAETTSNAVNITVSVAGPPTQTIEKRIAGSMDDVEQDGTNGSMYTNSSDIELVNDGSAGDQTIGLRFTGLNIPQGATINNAYIQFTTDETSSGSTNLTIRGQDVNDAPAFTTSTNNVSGRTTTSASVNWNPPAWNSVGASGSAQRTSGIESIVQEIVNRPGWSSGNDMVMIITGTGERTAESYDGVPNSAALIHIEYSTGGGCSTVQVDFHDFESGYGIWNDGGSDCSRISSTTYANSGSYSLRLRDDSSSSFTDTDLIDLSDFEEVTLDFSYMCNSMDNSSEDFFLQISTNGGSSYTTVEEWNRGDEFENNIRYNDAVTIQGPFTSNVRFRFVCDASSNGDEVYLDDITISGCSNANNVASKSTIALVTDDGSIGSMEPDDIDSGDLDHNGIELPPVYSDRSESITIYPNPFKNRFTIDLSNIDALYPNPFGNRLAIDLSNIEAIGDIKLYNMDGKLVYEDIFVQFGNNVEINTGKLPAGTYLLKIQIGNDSVWKKIMKR